LELNARGQAVEEQQIGCFQKRALRRKFLNPDAAVFQHTGLTVDIADLRPSGRYSSKARHKVMRHGLELLSRILALDFPNVSRRQGSALKPSPSSAILAGHGSRKAPKEVSDRHGDRHHRRLSPGGTALVRPPGDRGIE